MASLRNQHVYVYPNDKTTKHDKKDLIPWYMYMSSHIFGNKPLLKQLKSFQKTSLVFSAGNHDFINYLHKNNSLNNYRHNINPNMSVVMHYRNKRSSLIIGNQNMTYKAIWNYFDKLKPLVKQALKQIFTN